MQNILPPPPQLYENGAREWMDAYYIWLCPKRTTSPQFPSNLLHSSHAEGNRLKLQEYLLQYHRSSTFNTLSINDDSPPPPFPHFAQNLSISQTSCSPQSIPSPLPLARQRQIRN